MPLHIIYRYYAISITVLFFAATWYRKFFAEIVKRLFSCVVRAIWKISFVPTWIQILGHGFTFLVAAYRSVRYNTLTDIPIYTCNIRDAHMSPLNFSDIKSKLSFIANYISHSRAVSCWIFSREIQARYKNARFNFSWRNYVYKSLYLRIYFQSVKERRRWISHLLLYFYTSFGLLTLYIRINKIPSCLSRHECCTNVSSRQSNNDINNI